MNPVSGVLGQMIAGLKAIRRRLRAPTASDVDALEELKSQGENPDDERRARERIDRIRGRLLESEEDESPPSN